MWWSSTTAFLLGNLGEPIEAMSIMEPGLKLLTSGCCDSMEPIWCNVWSRVWVFLLIIIPSWFTRNKRTLLAVTLVETILTVFSWVNLASLNLNIGIYFLVSTFYHCRQLFVLCSSGGTFLFEWWYSSRPCNLWQRISLLSILVTVSSTKPFKMTSLITQSV